MSLDSMMRYSVDFRGPVTYTSDTRGGQSPSWPTVRQASVRASVQPASGRVQMLYAQQGIVVTHTVITRYAGGQVGDVIVLPEGDYCRIVGRRTNRAMGAIPDFTQYDAEQVSLS
jgi:hypothetical protein